MMPRKVHTLESIWEDFAVRRRAQVRDWQNDEGRWELYVAHDPIASVPLGRLARRAWGEQVFQALATRILRERNEGTGAKVADAIAGLVRDAIDRPITPAYRERLAKCAELMGGRRAG